MSFRFRKSIRLGKHLRINLSKSGIGASVGVKGLRIGTGRRGQRITASLPGTGISYVAERGHKRQSSGSRRLSSADTAVQSANGLPFHEREWVRGLYHYLNGHMDWAEVHFLAAAPRDAGAALFAAVCLSPKDGEETRAIGLLESLLSSDAVFPMPLMEKHLAEADMWVGITEEVTVTVPMGRLAALLLLAKLYEDQGETDKAIRLLLREEVVHLRGKPAITLLLCSLYSERESWDKVIERATGTEPYDDITEATVTLLGRAMQEKGVHEATARVKWDQTGRGGENEMSSDPFEQAVALASAGKQAEARQLFAQLIVADVHHELAWLWYASTLTTREDMAKALEECLYHNPQCVGAQERLAVVQVR